MLASSKKTLNNSTVATSKSSVAKQKETFFAFVFRKIRQAFARMPLGLVDRTHRRHPALRLRLLHGDAKGADEDLGRNGARSAGLLIDLDILYHSLSNYPLPPFCFLLPSLKLRQNCWISLRYPWRLQFGCGLPQKRAWRADQQQSQEQLYRGMSESLCVKCQKFYGNAKSLNMCSVCYKSLPKQQQIVNEVSNFKIPQVPQPKAAKQADLSRCFLCKKKVGLLGYNCKGCDCSYCNSHRLPEDHKCDGNFIEMAKAEIKRNNPNITAAKIEKI